MVEGQSHLTVFERSVATMAKAKRIKSKAKLAGAKDPDLKEAPPSIPATVEPGTPPENDKPVAEPTPKVEEGFGKDSVDIVKNDVEYIRTYSKAVHGEDWKKLAKQFCEKFPKCKLVPSESVKSILVEYKRPIMAEDKVTILGYERAVEKFQDKEVALVFKNRCLAERKNPVCRISKK